MFINQIAFCIAFQVFNLFEVLNSRFYRVRIKIIFVLLPNHCRFMEKACFIDPWILNSYWKILREGHFSETWPIIRDCHYELNKLPFFSRPTRTILKCRYVYIYYIFFLIRSISLCHTTHENSFIFLYFQCLGLQYHPPIESWILLMVVCCLFCKPIFSIIDDSHSKHAQTILNVCFLRFFNFCNS